MSWSTFAENRLIDWFFRGYSIGITGASAGVGSGPSSVFLGLFAGDPSQGGVEVTGNAYARAAVAASNTNWGNTQGVEDGNPSTGTTGITRNLNSISFPTPTPSGWGVVTHLGAFDSLSGGSLLFHAPLQDSKNISPGDPVAFAPRSIGFNINV